MTKTRELLPRGSGRFVSLRSICAGSSVGCILKKRCPVRTSCHVWTNGKTRRSPAADSHAIRRQRPPTSHLPSLHVERQNAKQNRVALAIHLPPCRPDGEASAQIPHSGANLLSIRHPRGKGTPDRHLCQYITPQFLGHTGHKAARRGRTTVCHTAHGTTLMRGSLPRKSACGDIPAGAANSVCTVGRPSAPEASRRGTALWGNYRSGHRRRVR
jgi:hypothetical protein